MTNSIVVGGKAFTKNKVSRILHSHKRSCCQGLSDLHVNVKLRYTGDIYGAFENN